MREKSADLVDSFKALELAHSDPFNLYIVEFEQSIKLLEFLELSASIKVSVHRVSNIAQFIWFNKCKGFHK